MGTPITWERHKLKMYPIQPHTILCDEQIAQNYVNIILLYHDKLLKLIKSFSHLLHLDETLVKGWVTFFWMGFKKKFSTNWLVNQAGVSYRKCIFSKLFQTSIFVLGAFYRIRVELKLYSYIFWILGYKSNFLCVSWVIEQTLLAGKTWFDPKVALMFHLFKSYL